MPRIGDTFDQAQAPRGRAHVYLATLLIAALAQDAHAQRPLDANNPASLLPATTAPAAERPAPASETKSASPSGIERPAAPIVVPPASESRPLGKPNGALSARPAATVNTVAAPQKAPSDESSGGLLAAIDPRKSDFTRVLGALAAVIGLILLVRTLAVRFMPSLFNGAGERPSGVIEILARYPAGRGQQLIVLKFARRILLIHQTGSTARTLTEMSDPDEVATTLSRLEAGASTRSAAKFKAALQSFNSEHEAAIAQRSRSGAALAAAETEIIDLTRTQIRQVGSMAGPRRLLR